jgi:hypothetical protein
MLASIELGFARADVVPEMQVGYAGGRAVLVDTPKTPVPTVATPAPNTDVQQANRRHTHAQCQLKSVCVPLVLTTTDLCSSRSSMAAATVVSPRISPQETGAAIGRQCDRGFQISLGDNLQRATANPMRLPEHPRADVANDRTWVAR